MNNQPVIIFVVATSAGEVDWMLPALVDFKERYPDWQIISLFGHKLVFQKLQENRALFHEFGKVSDLNVVPQELESLFTENITPDQVKIILKDYNKDEFAPYKTYLDEKCPMALHVNFPHSKHIYANKDVDDLQTVQNPEAWSKHDIFLLGSENDVPHWSAHVDTARIRTLGYPAYDSWWIERLLQAPGFQTSREVEIARQAGKVFFYISRGVHPHYLSQADYEYLVDSILRETLAYEDAFLFIKPHPRQDIGELLKLLQPYDDSRWMLSGLHLLQLSSLADVVVSGWSSGILDACAVGKPVIEFWRFGGKDPLCRKTPEGQYTTIYRELGLAAPANSREELSALIGSALDSPQADPWKIQRAAFLKNCKMTDNASAAIVNCLMTEVEKKAGKKGSRQVREEVSELIDKQIDYIASLIEQGEEGRAREWFDFLSAQFPEEPKVFNNLGVFLFNQGEFIAAVDNLVMSLNLDPEYLEAAVNLVQILLELGQTAEAVDIVISFYTNTQGQSQQTAFLHALKEQLSEEQFALVLQELSRLRTGTDLPQ